jgi:peptidoglycan/LPS O-acetylase OafA/YrhL
MTGTERAGTAFRSDIDLMKKNRFEPLLIIDGIAIFLIVSFHTLFYFPEYPFTLLQPYTGFFGLTLFTFSAGYKLGYNHLPELGSKKFLHDYFIKRCIRLYKPYLGYTLLMVIPACIISYGAVYLHLPYRGAADFIEYTTNMSVVKIIAFFIGRNPIADHLWYLVALIIITAISFSLLYFLDLKRFFYGAIPFILLSWLCKISYLDPELFPELTSPLLSRIITYYPFFVFGIWYACQEQEKKPAWHPISRVTGPVLFLVLLVSSACIRGPGPVSGTLLYGSAVFVPFFLLAIAGPLQRAGIIYQFLTFCGIYSFQIYLFQWPVIIPVLCRVMTDILKLHFILVPLLISVTGIGLSVIGYRIAKQCHLDVLFE